MIGGGSWGTAFARLLAMAGHETTLVCRDRDQAHAVATHHRNPRYLFDVELPATLGAAWLNDAQLSSAELVAMAVPSRGFAETLELLAPRLGDDAALLSLTKGLDPATHRRMSEVLETVAPRDRIAVLSGPNHAEEVARDYPTASVLASDSIDLARRLQAAVSTSRLRVYASTDVVGVELCAAAKNVMGLAAGVSDGLGFGDNAKAAIITRGMAEMARMGEAFGAKPAHLLGHGRHGRSGRHVHVAAVPQPTGGRAARQGRPGGLDRAGDRAGGGGADDRPGAARPGPRQRPRAADHRGRLQCRGRHDDGAGGACGPDGA